MTGDTRGYGPILFARSGQKSLSYSVRAAARLGRTLTHMVEKILLVDHRPSMRKALRLYLGRFPQEWQVVDEAESADLATLQTRIDQFRPQIIILFCHTAGNRLRAILATLHSDHAELAVLVTGINPQAAAEIIGWGADGLLLTTDSPSTLLTRLRVLRFDRAS